MHAVPSPTQIVDPPSAAQSMLASVSYLQFNTLEQQCRGPYFGSTT
jgi:hypothetical protein